MATKKNGRSVGQVKTRSSATANGKASGILKPGLALPSQNKRPAAVPKKPISHLPVQTNGGENPAVKPNEDTPHQNGDARRGLKSNDFLHRQNNGRGETADNMKTGSVLSHLCHELQNRQRVRSVYLKSRNMIANRLRAAVAIALGYKNELEENDREKMFDDAQELIDRVAEGEPHQLQDFIRTTQLCINEFDRMKEEQEKEMKLLAAKLPVAGWVEESDQKGFSVLGLAIVVGECGDLGRFGNPGKLWRWMGCAPWEFNGKIQMGATWKKIGLPAEEWTKFKYCPRRRSIAYIIGENLVKQNKYGKKPGPYTAGPYRQRYLTKKAEAIEKHPEWVSCPTCKATGKNSKGNACGTCKGKGRLLKRVHLYGMLLASKLLLKNLWIEWRKGNGETLLETGQAGAVP